MVTTDDLKQELRTSLNDDQSRAFDDLINFVNQKFDDPGGPEQGSRVKGVFPIDV